MKRFFQVALAVALAVLPFTVSHASASGGRVIRIGSDVSYAPLEFFDRKVVRGFDYDLAQALGAKLNARVEFTNQDFNSLPKALAGGRYDAVISAMSDTRSREKALDFVDYFLAGTGILVRHGNPQHIFSLDALCGLTVDVEKGTAQEAAIAKASQRCRDLHLKPIAVLSFATDADAFKALQEGKSVAHVSDYPVVAYQARTFNDGKTFEVAGRQFGVIPYGIAVTKTNARMRTELQSALRAVIADGTYDTLLKKWGLEQGAMRAASVNSGTKFE
ncbi:MAG: ABC transporter substrate-binding protein [Candidatus Eremiobacteraeota bacterium]|nr:ABC transporter substrate-binding protein [Candidatus Eremiobacteraeota bacterium]